MKKIIFINVFIVFTHLVNSQIFDWAYTNGGFTDNFLFCSELTKNNEVILASNGIIRGIESEVIFCKLDQNGKIFWMFYPDYSSFCVPTDVVIDSNEDVIFTGYYSSMTIGDSELTHSTQPRSFILKLDKNGNLIWIKDFGSPSVTNATYSNAVSVDYENNIYLTGTFNTSLNFGDNQLLSNGSTDIFIASINAEGDPLWAKSYGGISDDWTYDIDVFGETMCIAGAYTDNNVVFDTIVPPNIENASIIGFVANFNLDGSINWITTNESYKWSFSEILDLAHDTNGNIYGYGQYEGELKYHNDTLKSPSSIAGSMLYKMDRNGHKIWARQVDNSVYEFFSDHLEGTIYRKNGAITCDDNNNLFLGSSFKDSLIIADKNLKSGNEDQYWDSRDIFIAKFNEIGYVQWMRIIEGASNDRITSIHSSGDKFVVAGIYKSDSLRFDTTLIENYAGKMSYDVFCATFGDTTTNKCPVFKSKITSIRDYVCEDHELAIACNTNYGNTYSLFLNDTLLGTSYNMDWSVSKSGQYNFIINKDLVCSDTTLSKLINKRDKPQVDLKAESILFDCYADSVKLESKDSVVYLYSWYHKTDLLNSDTSILFIKTPGLYICEINDGYCINRDTLLVEMDNPKINMYSDNTVICPGDTVVLFTEYDTSYIYSWFLNDFDLSLDSNNIRVEKGGKYTVNVNKGKCKSSDSVTIISSYAPVFTFEKDTIYSDVLPIRLSPENDSTYEYNWYFEDTNFISSNFTIDASRYGKYKIIVENRCGAVADSIYVILDVTDNYQGIDKEGNILIYPNPTKGLFTIYSTKDNYTFELTDINGRLIVENDMNFNKVVDISKMSRGVYIINIKRDNIVVKQVKILKN
ncbi:T9SS type A sorting domain-containing protein [Saccharicrinis sp. FJH62]|uniref:T9SS type A sorting domain-containing protein n=1 Tax=Saccharicrinis sp. FJH62 TaxID=3344657 RepID=UPI0035D46E3D